MSAAAADNWDAVHDANPRRFLHPRDGNWYVQIAQGQFYVTRNPAEYLTTVLGSCIAACIRDTKVGVGGMNHFLLPEGTGQDRDALRFGVNAMELLLNAIFKRGGSRQNLEAKLFGGANVIPALSDIGSRNLDFATTFLADEGIRLAGGDVGGKSARRIHYQPATGNARRLLIADGGYTLIERELNAAKRAHIASGADANGVELF